MREKHPLCFLAHDVELGLNIGHLFRIADALGVERIYLSGRSAVPPDSKIRTTSRSAEKYVPFVYEANPLEIVDRLKREAYEIISLEITSSSIDIIELAIAKSQRVCLILGAENAGVSQELLDASDQTVHIPMRGQNSSMNVATACAIATYEIVRRYLA